MRWSATVGGGYSSPILTSELVIVMSEPNVVMALNRTDGKPRWKVKVTPADLADEDNRKVAAEYQPPKAGSGLAAATPLTDGQRVYVMLANGLVQAIDLDGKTVWTTFIAAQQNTAYGRASSPILCGGKLIVHMTNLFAFDPATGKQLWVNSEAKSTYATPVGLKIGGLDVIVTPAGDAVRCDTGELVDSNIAGTTHSSPIAQDDVIYFAESAVSADRLDAKFKDKELWSSMIPGDVFGSPLLHANLLLVASGKGELFAYDAKGKGSRDPIFEPRPLFGPGGNVADCLFQPHLGRQVSVPPFQRRRDRGAGSHTRGQGGRSQSLARRQRRIAGVFRQGDVFARRRQTVLHQRVAVFRGRLTKSRLAA